MSPPPSPNPRPSLVLPHKGKEGEAKDPYYIATITLLPLDMPVLIKLYDKLTLITQHNGAGTHSAEAKPNYGSTNKLSLKNVLMISKPAHTGAPHNLHSNSSKCSIPGISSANRRTLYLPPLFLLSPPLSFQSSSSRLLLQVALSVKGGGEGHVVEGSGDGVGPCVGCHAGNAVLCLIGGKLPPQLLGRDKVLIENREDGRSEW